MRARVVWSGRECGGGFGGSCHGRLRRQDHPDRTVEQKPAEMPEQFVLGGAILPQIAQTVPDGHELVVGEPTGASRPVSILEVETEDHGVGLVDVVIPDDLDGRRVRNRVIEIRLA